MMRERNENLTRVWTRQLQQYTCSFLVYQPNQRRKAKSQKGAPENIPGMPLKDYYEIWLVYTW